jgi:gliding motility-associated-like protein
MEGNKNLTKDYRKYLHPYSLLKIFFIALPLIFCHLSYAQVQFATLNGAPLDTNNWEFNGVAKLGTTSLLNPSGSELILCAQNNLYSFGQAYYKTPLKVNPTCNQWTVSFDFRINDGNAADGLAFFYVANPDNPTGDGSALGIPMSTTGIAVAIDTYENCCPLGYSCSFTQNPKLEIRVLSPTVNYSECDSASGYQKVNLTFLRSSNYQNMRIEYKSDSIYVFVDSALILQGYVALNLNGYFGFSAGTGGSFDTHSIRNVAINIPRTSLTVDAGRDTSVCAGTSLQLGSDSLTNYTYTWTPAIFLNSSENARPIFTTTIPGIYRYSLRTDSTRAQCYSTDNISITVAAKPYFSIYPSDTLICRNQTVILPKINSLINSTIPGLTLSWLPLSSIDTTNSFTPTFSTNITTTYTLTAKNPMGNCTFKDTLRIQVDDLPLPNVNIGHDTLICENQLIVLRNSLSTAGAIYTWNTGTTGLVDTINSAGTYWLSSKNSNGCKGQSDTLIAHACPPEITSVPNIFTPNNDEKNESFFVVSKNINQYDLKVINRWGEAIYSTNDKNFNWDARNIPDGIYYYYIEYNGLGEYSDLKKSKGYFQIIR